MHGSLFRVATFSVVALVVVGPLGAAERAGVWCNFSAAAIPDNDVVGVSRSIVVATGDLADAIYVPTVYVAIDHVFVGDLVVDIADTAEDEARLLNQPECAGDNVAATFDDFAPIAADTLCDGPPAAIHGAVWPTDTLWSTSDSLNGTWTLTASDRASSDVGTLRAWCLLSEVLFYDGFESANFVGWTDDQPSAAP